MILLLFLRAKVFTTFCTATSITSIDASTLCRNNDSALRLFSRRHVRVHHFDQQLPLPAVLTVNAAVVSTVYIDVDPGTMVICSATFVIFVMIFAHVV